MKAFVIATETAKDEAMFAEYRKAVPATIEAFGGKFIVRGGDLKLLEGQWPHPRLSGFLTVHLLSRLPITSPAFALV